VERTLRVQSEFRRALPVDLRTHCRRCLCRTRTRDVIFTSVHTEDSTYFRNIYLL
jgi:hypothetical protein